MTDESGDLTVGARKADTFVDTAGEVGNTVLKVLPVHLHNLGFVLNDGNIWGFRHLARGVPEAVLGYDGVRVDDEDDLSDTQGLTVDCRQVSDQNLSG
jgi:hypothetical protein